MHKLETEHARASLEYLLEHFDATNWGDIMLMASFVQSAAGVEQSVIDYEQTHNLYQTCRAVIVFNEELPKEFKPFIGVLLENYDSEEASEGEKHVQYLAQTAIDHAREDHRAHLVLFFGE